MGLATKIWGLRFGDLTFGLVAQCEDLRLWSSISGATHQFKAGCCKMHLEPPADTLTVVLFQLLLFVALGSFRSGCGSRLGSARPCRHAGITDI